MALREVLIVAYYFPPLGMGGVQRITKFVKYLPRSGWRPLVLTVKPIRYFTSDASLLKEISHEAEVFRTGSLDPLRVASLFSLKSGKSFVEARLSAKPALDWFAIPDVSLGWLPLAVSSGLSILHSRSPEAILATAPPYTAHLVGGALAWASGLPLVLDYRDAWTFDSPRSFPTGFHHALNRLLEKEMLRTATRVLAVNEPIAQGLRSALDFPEKDKVHVLPLGYDPGDFEQAKASEPLKFRISHVGTLIGERSPKSLLIALKYLFEKHPELREKIEVRFVGLYRTTDQSMIQDAGMEDVVTCVSYRPHAEVIAELLSAHVLYLVIGAKEGETISTGKLYEYLGARKPILTSAPPCEAARTIQETGAGSVFHPEDSEGLAQEIIRFYNLYCEGRLKGPTIEAVQRYDRREITKELARHLSEVA